MNNNKGFAPIIIIITLIVVLSLSFGIYFFTKYKNKENSKNSNGGSTKSRDVSNNSTPNQNNRFKLSQMEFRKRQYEANEKFFGDISYPVELTSIADSNLVPMRCSDNFSSRSHGAPLNQLSYFDDSEKKEILLADDVNFFPHVTKINNAVLNGISSLRYCETNDHNYLVLFHEWVADESADSPWEAGSEANFIMVNQNGEISNLTTIKDSEDLSSPDCWKPLLLTSSNIAYFQCGIFQKLPEAESSIFKIDFNTKSSTLTTSCSQEPKEQAFSYNVLNFKYNPQDFIIECK